MAMNTIKQCLNTHIRNINSSLLVGLLLLLSLPLGAQVDEDVVITMKTNKAIGDTIVMEFADDSETFRLEGATLIEKREAFFLKMFYKVTSPTLKLFGDIGLLMVPRCGLTEIDLGKHTRFGYIDCSNNQLKRLDLSNVTLGSLYCENNQLEELDLSKSPNLKMLTCQNNKLREIDLSNKPKLSEVDCSGNALERLELSGSNLERLNCENNNIRSLDLRSCDNLTRLYCRGNDLGEIDLSHSPECRTLDCSINKLTDIRVSDRTSFVFLSLHSNRLKDSSLKRLVSSLRDVTPNTPFVCIDKKNLNEGNEVSQEIVDLATEKGFSVRDYNGGIGEDGKVSNKGIVYIHPEGISQPRLSRDDLHLYPNPAYTYVNIVGAHHGEPLRLYTLDGKLVRQQILQGEDDSLDLSKLERGIYILLVGPRAKRITLK